MRDPDLSLRAFGKDMWHEHPVIVSIILFCLFCPIVNSCSKALDAANGKTKSSRAASSSLRVGVFEQDGRLIAVLMTRDPHLSKRGLCVQLKEAVTEDDLFVPYASYRLTRRLRFTDAETRALLTDYVSYADCLKKGQLP